MAKGTHKRGRIDVVMVRKSGDKQDEQAQAANVKAMLDTLSVSVSKDYWFYCTVPRAHVKANADFKKLLSLVENDEVDTVYVETQDRFGTDDVAELFTMITLLRTHETHLYDLRERLDLTKKDETTLMRTFIGGIKSSKERQDTAFRALRTKIDLFSNLQSWPTGSQPFGFGKRCYESDGKTLLWEWQPVSRAKGQLFYANSRGKLIPGPKDVGIPVKEKGKRWVTKLVPSNNKVFVKTVQLIFELFANVGMSMRKISERLNDEGRTFYDKPFTFSLVRQILNNPAYVGDTHFGKVKSAANWTFDADGQLQKVETASKKEFRGVDDQLVQANTHKGLVDRKTWNRAQRKVADMRERVCFAPRNPRFFLKPILVCGHCNKNMTGRMEKKGDEKVPVYFCSSYIAGRSNGQKGKCGAYRITHADAEKLLMDKMKELNLSYDKLKNTIARENVSEQVDKLGEQDLAMDEAYRKLVQEGIDALDEFYRRNRTVSARTLKRLRADAEDFYTYPRSERTARLRDTLELIERESVAHAKKKVAELTAELAGYTRLQATANERPAQLRIIEEQCKKLDAEIREWEGRTKPITERLTEAYDRWNDIGLKIYDLEKELPLLDDQERGEALRRVFKTVILRWDAKFIPRSDKPSRPIKTDREGRWRYPLLNDEIRWVLDDINLGGFS